MKRIGLAVFSALIVFDLAAFVAWDFNPGNWTTDGRCYTALCAAVAIIITLVATSEIS